MFEKIVKSRDLGPESFPFPGYTGNITIKLLNKDYALGPLMLHLRMEPGSYIPAHLHKKSTEVLCILEGDFIDEDAPAYGPGDSLHCKPGTVHGPHSTKTGCSILVLWNQSGAEGDTDDFYLAEEAAA